MSQWQRVMSQERVLEHVQASYSANLPIEVRHFLADWIEEQPWNDIDEENPSLAAFGPEMLNRTIEVLQRKANEMDSSDLMLMKLKLLDHAQTLRTRYAENPMQFVRVVKSCLATEARLLEMAGTSQDAVQTGSVLDQLSEQFKTLNRLCQEREQELKLLQDKQESFIIQYQEGVKLQYQLNHLREQASMDPSMRDQEQKMTRHKEALDRELSQRAQDLLKLRVNLVEQHRNTAELLTAVQRQILDQELIGWKRRQQLAGIGMPFEGTLDTLQQWCEALAVLLWQTRQQVKRVELLRYQLPMELPQGQPDLLPDLSAHLTGLLSTLVTSTFIIEHQPPQVLKKDTRFGCSVRLLVGGKLNVHMNPPTVKATMINEKQARSILANDSKAAKQETAGELLNNQAQMEFNEASGELGVTFRNMQLKKIKRADRNQHSQTVVEEKFSILFQSEFSIGGGELIFQVWTLSLPVVVIVHGNQECNATATIFWDNAFAEPGRVPFTAPDPVPWSKLSNALLHKFGSMTGKPLSDDNLTYLAGKLFNAPNPSTNFSKLTIAWSQFNKEPLSGRNFTFWEWFYDIMKLIKEYLRAPWADGLVMGFVSKTAAQEMLLSKPTGTFLLRFSDSERGGTTIAWVAEDPQKPGERSVWNLAPYQDKDFKIRSVSDRIKDLQNLVTLYPDIPKNEAFGKFYVPVHDIEKPTPSGYVTTTLVDTIARPIFTPGQVMSLDNPQTPSNPQTPHSPPSANHAAAANPVYDTGALTGAGAPIKPPGAGSQYDMNADEDWAMDITAQDMQDLLNLATSTSN